MKNLSDDSKNSLYASDVKHISKNLSGFIKNKKKESINERNKQLNQKTK